MTRKCDVASCTLLFLVDQKVFKRCVITISLAVTDVAIGLEQTVYSVTESDSFALVCTTVLSGSIAGRTLSIGYQTAEDSALGKNQQYHIIIT